MFTQVTQNHQSCNWRSCIESWHKTIESCNSCVFSLGPCKLDVGTMYHSWQEIPDLPKPEGGQPPFNLHSVEMSRRNLGEGRLGSEGPDQTQTQTLTTSPVIRFQKENTGQFSCLVLFWVLKNGKLARKKGERKQSWGWESQKRKKEEGTGERRELSLTQLWFAFLQHLCPLPRGFPAPVTTASRGQKGEETVPWVTDDPARWSDLSLSWVCAPGSWLACPLYKPLMTHCSLKSFRTSKTSSS